MHYNPKIVTAYFRSMGLPEPEYEWQFLVDRKFRFDLAWPDRQVAIECQGGIWTGGAHARGGGIRRDIEKHNLAVINGWRVLYCEPKDLCTLKFVEMIRQVLGKSYA